MEQTIAERSHKNEFIPPNHSTMSDNEQMLANVGFSQENIARVRKLYEEKKSLSTRT